MEHCGAVPDERGLAVFAVSGFAAGAGTGRVRAGAIPAGHHLDHRRHHRQLRQLCPHRVQHERPRTQHRQSDLADRRVGVAAAGVLWRAVAERDGYVARSFSAVLDADRPDRVAVLRRCGISPDHQLPRLFSVLPVHQHRLRRRHLPVPGDRAVGIDDPAGRMPGSCVCGAERAGASSPSRTCWAAWCSAATGWCCKTRSAARR